MNQITKNVEQLLNKYKSRIDSDNKLVLAYLKSYHNLRFDSNYVSTSDFLNIDMKLIQQIIDARYILTLLEEEK